MTHKGWCVVKPQPIWTHMFEGTSFDVAVDINIYEHNVSVGTSDDRITSKCGTGMVLLAMRPC